MKTRKSGKNDVKDIEEMQGVTVRKIPWTRFEWPEKITVVKNLRPDKPSIDVICCDDLESAKKLRTELIRSLELLNFYIDQVEESGEIRYVR